MSQCSLNFSTIFLQYCPSENVWSIFNRRRRHRTYFSLKSKSAEDVAELFVDEILIRHGAPKVLVSDGGKEFTNSIYCCCYTTTFFGKNKIRNQKEYNNGTVIITDETAPAEMDLKMGREQSKWAKEVGLP